MGGEKKGLFGRTLGLLGDLLDDGVINGSNAIKNVAKKSWDASYGISHAENEARVANDNLHDLYETAMRKQRRGAIHGNPEMEKLNQILANNNLSLEQFEKQLIARYHKVGH